MKILSSMAALEVAGAPEGIRRSRGEIANGKVGNTGKKVTNFLLEKNNRFGFNSFKMARIIKCFNTIGEY